MSSTQSPTPEELRKAEEVVSNFDKAIQKAAVFNQPLTKAERALLVTFYLFLQRQRSKTGPAQ